MRTKPAIWSLTLVISVAFGPIAAFGAEGTQSAAGGLRDGVVLRGIDGTVQKAADSDEWFFELGSEVGNGTVVVKAGTNLRLLPSLALEKMTGDVKKRPETSYRIWARVTKYKNRNFLFPIYFVPLSKTAQSGVSPSQKAAQESKSIIGEPNDALTIPQEILKKLETQQVVRPRTPDRPDAETQKQKADRRDSMLIDRTGLLSLCVSRSASYAHEIAVRYDFILDALGRDVQQIRLRLLPSQALELAEYTQSVQPDPIHFKVAGILTEYKDEKYLLLHRATRVYSHGNFGY
jgi:hypothetical protein